MGFDLKSVFILALVFGILVSVQGVESLGVTRPVPHDVELMIGEEAGFSFQIQAVTSTTDISCTYNINGMDPLVIEFDEEEAIVAAGAISDIYGTVSVPEGTEIKVYNGKLTVSCGSVEDVSGSAVKTTIGDSPFNVNVVTERVKEIREVSAPETPVDYTLYMVLIIVIAIIVVVYYFKFRKKKAGVI